MAAPMVAESVPKSEIVSNLPLQMAIFFNTFYAPCWIITHICTLTLKFHVLGVTYQVILVAVHIFALLVEVSRLYLGWVGNLMEKIPELSGFWITTVILQLPVTCFLLFNTEIILLPLETAVDSVHLLFLIVQIGCGFAAVRKVAKHQLARFQQQVLNKSDNETDDDKVA